MNAFHQDIRQQADVLRQLTSSCRQGGLGTSLAAHAQPGRVVLTGMGASYNAGLWGSYALRAIGVSADAVESSELLHFGGTLLEDAQTVIVISQSGMSAEVLPLLARIPSQAHVIAVTNGTANPLARQSTTCLDIRAGTETTVAAKTYLNTMACLWLLVAAWGGRPQGEALDEIEAVAGAAQQLIVDEQAIADAWIGALGGCDKIVYVGHGPHVPTARQGAMMMGEWLKRLAVGSGLGAFRHGLIEITDERTGVIVFGAGGVTDASTALLTRDLESYGATVLNVVEGRIVEAARPQRQFAELLSPILDVMPIQIFVEATARRLMIAPAFRHISKVINTI